VYTHYDTHAQAVAAGAFAHGWIPDNVPSSATDIHEEHDLDTNQAWIRFSLPPAEVPFLSDRMGFVPVADVGEVTVTYPCQVHYWFFGLIEQQPANDSAMYAWVYEAPRNGGAQAYVAVDKNSPTVYYWTASPRAVRPNSALKRTRARSVCHGRAAVGAGRLASIR
jgi:hypothetical protein